MSADSFEKIRKGIALVGVATDPTDNLEGSMWFNSTSSRFKIYSQGAVREVVLTGESQVLTNVDFDGGTASNTSRITVPTGTLAALTALARKEGTIVYATDTDALYTDNGVTLNPLSGTAIAALDEGISLTANMNSINFVGGGVTATNVGPAVTVTIPASTSSTNESGLLENLGLSVSVAANALTINLKQADGSTDPAIGISAVRIGFRSSTSASGAYNIRSTSSARTLTIPSGATLGQADSDTYNIWVYAVDDGGTVQLAVSSLRYDEGSVVTLNSLTAASDSNFEMYSTTGQVGAPIRLIGRLVSTQTTAGLWAVVPTQISLTPAIDAGEKIQAIYEKGGIQLIGSGSETIIDFSSKVIDTHNAVITGASWSFTAPKASRYQVDAVFEYAISALSVNDFINLNLYRAGVLYVNLDRFIAPAAFAAASNTRIHGGFAVDLLQGQTINLRTNHNTGTTETIASVPSFVSIYNI